jgi:hypothetical protein
MRALRQTSGDEHVTRNAISLCIGAACIVIGAVGYWLYQEQHRNGIEVSVGGRGITIETR